MALERSQQRRKRLTAHRPTKAEIDLPAFKANMSNVKRIAKDSTLLAVIKTNAYGHGIVPVSHAAIQAGAARLGVTTVEEGALLRECGINVPIHILSLLSPVQAKDVVRYKLTASVSSYALAHALSEAAVKYRRSVPVHLKIDTGLHRFGVVPHEAVTFCEACYGLPGLHWEGIYTHFSQADEGNWRITEQAFARFTDVVLKLARRGFTFSLHHVGGSTIAIERPDMHLDMVRPGIALFGYHPSRRHQKLVTLKRVMTLKSELLAVRKLPPNTPIGYGGRYVTASHAKIGVIPIGHGDGFQRALSNKGEVLIRGQRAKIVGTISLDQTFVDVTHIPHVTAGDEVVLIGKQAGDAISARDVADWNDTVVDEVISSLSDRIPRRYV